MCEPECSAPALPLHVQGVNQGVLARTIASISPPPMSIERFIAISNGGICVAHRPVDGSYHGCIQVTVSSPGEFNSGLIRLEMTFISGD